MTTWFEQNAAALMGHALTVIGIVGAALTVVWQLGRQHRSSLSLQKDNVRAELKLRLHEQLVQKVRKLSDANVEAAMYAYMVPFNVENFQRQHAQGLNPSPIKERASEFSRLHAEASDALSELIQEFEAWSIAFPGLEVFQVALNAANHNAREAWTSLFTALIKVLPMDPPANASPNMPRPLIPNLISSNEHVHLKKLVEDYKEAMDEIGCYIHDLTIESQNNLLSDLFERRVPLRQPIDPRCKVITANPEKASELLHYFENETPWGKMKKATEKDVRAMLEKL